MDCTKLGAWAMIDFEIAPYKVSEKVLAIKNIENSIETIKNKNPIIIFDMILHITRIFYIISRN